MAFTVRDFQSLVRALERRAEWKAELRRLLLAEELLALPQLVRELVEAHRRGEERLGRVEGVVRELVEAHRRGEERLGRVEGVVRELVEAHRRGEERLTRVEGIVAELVETQQRAQEQLARMEDRLGQLEGSDLERRYRERAPAFFQRVLSRIRPLDSLEIARLLDQAVEQGRLTAEERVEILLADLVLHGRREQQETYVLAEVSVVVDVADVRRATSRARLLEQALGVPVVAAVAGRRITPEAVEHAVAAGVVRVLDGRVEDTGVA